MSLHVFANFVTAFGTAANNRAETEGHITTLQKLIWQGQCHSTVSAEAIRFALRRRLADMEENGTNRFWDEPTSSNGWKDATFKGWTTSDGKTYIDDDLLGYMTAEAAKEGETSGKANVRRAVLEVTRAVSLTPWTGDVTFNAASPGATPSAQKKGTNPVPYGTEIHATRYQYGIALTPGRLREQSRAIKAIKALSELGTVAGNHGRFLYDFSPDIVVYRITTDPAPRILYCFDTPDDGKTITADILLQRLAAETIQSKELILGTDDLESDLAKKLRAKDVELRGIVQATTEALSRIEALIAEGD